MSRDRELERMMSDDPQSGMSTFDRNWNAANGLNGNGVKEPTASGTMLYRLAGEMTVRHMVIVAGDKMTAHLLLNAAEEMKKAADEIERLRKERDEARRVVCAFASGRYRKDVVTLDRAAAIAEADSRGWDCFKEVSNA